MHKYLNVTGLTYCATAIMRALPLADIDFGQFERVVLDQLHERKAYLAAHAPGIVLAAAYLTLMIWLMASSLATLRLRLILSVAVSVAALTTFFVEPAAAQSDDPSGVWLTQAGDARVRSARCSFWNGIQAPHRNA